MSAERKEFSENVFRVNVDGKEVYLVGTAHVSRRSVEDVRATIEAVRPDAVCIELCKGRYEAMLDSDLWRKMSVFKIVRQKKSVLFLAQLIMGAFYRKLGQKLGVQPGAEMLEAAKSAERVGAELVLADREIEITLKRVWGYVGLCCKLKMMVHILASVLFSDHIDEQLVEKLKSRDQLESILAEFTERFPEVRRRLIDERDIFMSQQIRQVRGQKVVVVVGAGHVAGIEKNINSDLDVEQLLEVPPKSVFPVVFKWAVSAAIIAIIVYGFFKEGAAHSLENIYIWILVNGILSAVGAAAAFGHPVTVLSAFVCAPVTSLNPMIGAGWVAGLVQAAIVRPTVEDFEMLSEATSSFKGFWRNPVTRILLVAAFANLGSVLGTYLAAAWIASRTL